MRMLLFDKTVAQKLLALVLRPAIRFAIRHGLKLQDIIDCTKIESVRVGIETLLQQGVKPNTTKISVITGVHRRDVRTIAKEGVPDGGSEDLITRIIGAWQTQPKFIRNDGAPRILSTEGGSKSQFAELICSVSTDMNPSAALLELERIGAVEARRNGIALVKSSFVPKGDVVEGFNICSKDIEDITRSVEENLLRDSGLPNLHARTEYDNVRPEGLESLKQWFLHEGHKFHSKVREIISQHDQDINPDPTFKGRGRRVVFSTFSFVDIPKERGRTRGSKE